MSINRSFTKLFSVFATGLLASQVCQALPAPASVSFDPTLASRELPPGLAGDTKRPEAKDLVIATRMMSKSESAALNDFKGYITALLGFLNRDQAWVQNWFATSEEVVKLSALGTPPVGGTYVMQYHEDDGGRHGVAVTPDWVWKDFLSSDEAARVSSADMNPWWPWGLLQGALDGTDNTLNLEAIVLALSGEKLISPEVKKDNEYWDEYLVEANRSPMWIDIQGSYFAVLGTTGEKKKDAIITLGFASHSELFKQDRKFSEIKGEIQSIHVLEGLPGVPELRKGKTIL